jgi:hypothetical protein
MPTIYYAASSSKVKLYSRSNDINVIANSAVGDNTLVDLDAIKSENNVSVEVKEDSRLYMTSLWGDGIDSGDVKITDTKGVLICTNCGQRGIKGACICIGPNFESTSSVVTTFYTDSTDTANYKEFEGAVIVSGNHT